MAEATTNEQEWARGMRREKNKTGKEEIGSQQEEAEKGGFRERIVSARKALDIKNKAKEKIAEKITAPARMGTSRLLQMAWTSLIPSFGLTLIWINIHVFLRLVLGEKLFCKLGDEWLMGKTKGGAMGGEAVKTAGRGIGLVEVLVLMLLDALALLIIGIIVAFIVMVVTWLSASWMEKAEMIWNAFKGLGWATLSALKSLF